MREAEMTVAPHADVIAPSEAWRGFAGSVWRQRVDVREFIQATCTPYEGGPEFLAGSAERTLAVWRKVRETIDHPSWDDESARLHEQQAAKALDEALRDVPADVEILRRTVEGPARKVLLDASHAADLLVVGAQRGHDRFAVQLGRVGHTVLHHSACPVAVVPQPV
jgi:nucleotide-binding universal stress UspA family protein